MHSHAQHGDKKEKEEKINTRIYTQVYVQYESPENQEYSSNVYVSG